MPGALMIGTFVKPMVEGALKVISMCVDVARELSLQAGNDVVKLKSVGRKVNPSRVGSEQSKCLSWPKTVALVPGSNVGLVLLHVLPQIIDVEFPLNVSATVLKVLYENRGPLFAGNFIIDELLGSSHISLRNIKRFGNINVRCELLIGLIVLMIERSTLKVDNSCASLHIIDCGCKSNLGTEAVSSKSGHRQLLFVHKSHDIVGNVIHIERFVVVRVSHVSVIEEPHISDVKNLVIFFSEELLEVLNRFDKITEPNHCW
jgi:hypothetical protein